MSFFDPNTLVRRLVVAPIKRSLRSSGPFCGVCCARGTPRSELISILPNHGGESSDGRLNLVNDASRHLGRRTLYLFPQVIHGLEPRFDLVPSDTGWGHTAGRTSVSTSPVGRMFFFRSTVAIATATYGFDAIRAVEDHAMHGIVDLKQTATERLEDARALFTAGRFAGSAYLAGYAVELALKTRICVTLGWSGFPETRREFERFQSLKTHDLEVLLRFSGLETSIKGSHLAEWSVVLGWDLTKRYSAATLTEEDARDMLDAAGTLVRVL